MSQIPTPELSSSDHRRHVVQYLLEQQSADASFFDRLVERVDEDLAWSALPAEEHDLISAIQSHFFPNTTERSAAARSFSVCWYAIHQIDLSELLELSLNTQPAADE